MGRRLREYRGFEVNQSQLAEELGISQGQLSRYEKGTSEIGAEVLLRLARKSGKSIEWCLTLFILDLPQKTAQKSTLRSITAQWFFQALRPR